MMYATQTAKDNYELKRRLYREENFEQLLLYYAKNNSEEEYQELLKYLMARSAVIKKIEQEQRWKYIGDSFLNRSNFVLEEITISYQENIVSKGEDGYYVDENSTEIAKDFFTKNQKLLKKLCDIDRLINSIYLKYKAEMDPILEAYNNASTFNRAKVVAPTRLYKLGDNPPQKGSMIHGETRHTQNYLYKTGFLGIKYLLRWLNRLNGEEEIKELLDDYKEDTSMLQKHFRESEKIKDYIDYGSWLGIILERYSMRGNLLLREYKQSKIPKRKRTTKL